MKILIFSEGNGYGHVARDRILAERLGAPIMTFGKGAEYCRQAGVHYIEMPAPYVIQNISQKAHIMANYNELPKFLKPSVMSAFRRHLGKAEIVIVDGSPLALAISELLGKKTIFITNDTSSLVGIQDAIGRRVASSVLYQLIKAADAVVVPDFPPPLTISALNLDASLGLRFVGPLVKNAKPKPHNKKFIVVGKLEKKVKPVLGGNAIYGSEVSDLLPYYRNAEMVVCHGGHTTIMEALAHGKPVIAVVDSTYAERVNNASMLERLGVGVKLDERTFNAESFLCAIDFARTLVWPRLNIYEIATKRSNAVGKVEEIINSL